MKIFFERSGGFMGRTVSTFVDTNHIPPEQALSILEKVEGAEFFDLPESPGAGLESAPGAADELCYKVTVEVAGVQHTVKTSELGAPQQLQPLLQELTRYARESNRPAGGLIDSQPGERR
jgi:hypothetical protein